MLDDMNVLDQFGVNEYIESLNWLSFDVESSNQVLNFPKNPRSYEKIIFISDGCNSGFILTQSLLKYGLKCSVPVFSVSSTELNYIDSKTLVIVDESIASRLKLRSKLLKLESQVVWLSNTKSKTNDACVIHSSTNHPEIDTLKACLKALTELKAIDRNAMVKINAISSWLRSEQKKWHPSVTFDKNLAKKVAIMMAGKTGLLLTSSENDILGQLFVDNFANVSKNLAFSERIEDLIPSKSAGWLSHPVEKPFAVIDIYSNLDSKSTQSFFAIKNRFLSGRMPASFGVKLEGSTRIEQYLYGLLLSKYCAVYLAVINKQPVQDSHFVDKLKLELSK